MSSWYIDRSRNLSSVFKEGMYAKLVRYIAEYDANEKFDTKDLVTFLGIGGKNPNAYLTYLRDIGLITEDNKPTNFLRTCVSCQLTEEQIIILLLIKRDSEKKAASNVKPFVVISKFLALQKKLGNEMKINWNHCDKYLMDISNYDEINDTKFTSLTFTDDFFEDRGVLDIWFNALLDSKLFTGTKKEIILSKEYESLIDFIAMHGESLPTNTTRDMYMVHCSSAYHGLPQLIFDKSVDAIKMLYTYPWMLTFANEAQKTFEGNVLLSKGRNILFYGIPGCGKSYHVEEILLSGVDKQNDVYRTTFYLDYSNSDFIGQIYPKVKDGNVSYEPIPGPFTKALKRALQYPDRMVYLVIEEINRGNAAAIFGDAFQLLDRLKTSKDGRLEGDSEYPITNDFIESYLDSLVQKGKVYIPRNMTILATMNTSDQNVFPLDTAFKRRWERIRVKGDWGKCSFRNMYIPYTDIHWETFANSINIRMVSKSENGTITEDKQMGPWFANEDMFTMEPNTKDDVKLLKFVNNVIDYLFNDVTKFEHDVLFNKEIKSFDNVDKFVDNVIDPEVAKKFIELFVDELVFINKE